MMVCDVKPVTLPIKERAVSLRYGICLITAASADYTLTESYMNSSTPVGSSSFPACRICVVTLACGKQISGPNIRIRSDLQSCSKIPATIMNVDLPVIFFWNLSSAWESVVSNFIMGLARVSFSSQKGKFFSVLHSEDYMASVTN